VNAEPPVIPPPPPRRFSVFVKITGICGLVLLLHIPLFLTNGVLRQRQGYQAQATAEIAGTWGRQQMVSGPVLAVPYTYKTQVIRSRVVNGRKVDVEETQLAPATAYFLPVTLAVDGSVVPEVRHRGIYETVVYSANLKLAGSFQPDFAAAEIEADQVDWPKAQVLFGVSDLHGVRSVGPLKIKNGSETSFETAVSGADPLCPLAAPVPGLAAGARLEFSFEAALQGSGQLDVAPVGKTTSVALQSDWPDPSFEGAALPMTRHVDAGGFKAQWESSHFSHAYPQSWTNRLAQNADLAEKIRSAAFGVRFARPVDGYGMADRAQKYGVLFFVLVFAVFFLFEVTAGLRIHPLQYSLVGAALCLFFLGFLALTELWPTGAAYGAAAGACTAMVSLYAWSFLRTGRRTLVIAGGLGATYGYLYFVLQSQDYALVAGTVALFAALALVMFCTRRLNWYSLDLPGTGNAGAAGR